MPLVITIERLPCRDSGIIKIKFESKILKTNDIRHKIIVILLIIKALIILRYDIHPTFI